MPSILKKLNITVPSDSKDELLLDRLLKFSGNLTRSGSSTISNDSITKLNQMTVSESSVSTLPTFFRSNKTPGQVTPTTNQMNLTKLQNDLPINSEKIEEKSLPALPTSFLIDYNAISINPKEISIGSCSKIYKGTWCGQEVAIKWFNNFSAMDDGYVCTKDDLASFKSEGIFCEMIKKKSFSWLPRYYGYVEHTEHRPAPFYAIVMEFLKEEDVCSLMQKNRYGLSEELYLQVLIATSAAIIDMHAHGILHGDLRWENIFYKKGEIKFVDLGSALFLGAESYKIRKVTSFIHYQAPEVKVHNKHSRESEIFSFGCMMFSIVENALHTEHSLKVYQQIAFSSETQKPTFFHSSPMGLVKLIGQCWQNDPSKRPTINDVHEKLVELKMNFS